MDNIANTAEKSKHTPAEPLPLIVGHTYEAKRKAQAGVIDPLWNDRMIVWIGVAEVQYDSPTVAIGRRLPKVSHEQFRRWAARDITSEMPNGEWRSARPTGATP